MTWSRTRGPLSSGERISRRLPPTPARLRPSLPKAAAALALAMALIACRASYGEPRVIPHPRTRLDPGAPSRCAERLPAGQPLQARLDAAADGAIICLAPGAHRGPISIQRPITLTGPRDAVVRSAGTGTTVEVKSDRVRLAGFTVDGSGTRHDTEDAAVALRRVNDVRVEGLRIVRAVFGILAERSNRLHIAENQIWGDPGSPLGLRGDAIRLWEVRDSEVRANRIHDSRDLVIWYSPGNTIRGNYVERGRYGTHLMYSHDNLLEDNIYRSNVVGVFSMYSRGLVVRRNQMLDAAGAGGIGLGAKEAGALQVYDNAFVHNEVAVYLDTTPLEPANEDRFENNLFAMNARAVVFHGRTSGNRFIHNSFQTNRVQVVVEGGGDARSAQWRHNHFDDYAGYDLDGDGLGDVPYELRSLSDQLVSKRPALSFFGGTPAWAIVEALGKLVPLFAPKTILTDPQPSTVAHILEKVDAD